jgi:predicted RNA binding protein YcfA (HicA-like mRNA interferase family)
LSGLPVLSGRRLVKVLGRLGYVVDRQHGSHIILRHSEPPHRRLVVPDHAEIAKGTLRALLRDAGLTVNELRRLL